LAAFGGPLMLFFARLSYHYGKMFDVAPEAALEYQKKYSKNQATGNQVPSRPEISYQPFDQIKTLVEIKAKYPQYIKLQQVADAIVMDLRITLVWLCLAGAMALFLAATILF
jgi:hypothetical protein